MTGPDYAVQSDPELIAASLDRGDRLAWETLLLRYQRLIYSIPVRMGFSPSDAADVFQTVCLLLMENLAFLRRRDRLGAWLVITTRRECWRLARERQTDQPNQDADAELEPAGNRLVTLEEEFVQIERHSLLNAALDSMEPRCRQLLRLLFWTEPRPSYEEIVKLMSLPEGSIGPTRARCLEKLTRILQRNGFWR
ncbi:MAG TPA: sigma-70 family RNA polymerase sigma factor [Anaerolineae bacterium]|nr:sigma-70 family RNA polymerase sigma factor [Anaerolineae bacterium]